MVASYSRFSVCAVITGNGTIGDHPGILCAFSSFGPVSAFFMFVFSSVCNNSRDQH